MTFFAWDNGADIQGIYRYLLWRIWDAKKPLVLFIMLNPSTAGAETNDKTVRRCIRFAHSWGYGGIMIVNLHALRSRYPKDLRRVPDPVGPRNDDYIIAYAKKVTDRGGIIVCAWGSDGLFMNRASDVVTALKACGHKLYCLGLTQKTQQPVHPLYVLGTTKPKRYKRYSA